MFLLELVAQGLVQGSIYALIALGLTLVYGLLRILHVAHAALFTLGAYAGVLTCNASGSLGCSASRSRWSSPASPASASSASPTSLSSSSRPSSS